SYELSVKNLCVIVVYDMTHVSLILHHDSNSWSGWIPAWTGTVNQYHAARSSSKESSYPVR
ncbi:MAG: hypothetical protein ACOYKZ_08155, partial [Chlamydiia bacterium]